MFDYRAGSLFKITNELPRRISVDVVVERHLLAGKQFRIGDTALHTSLVQTGNLVRVFSVTQICRLVILHWADAGKAAVKVSIENSSESILGASAEEAINSLTVNTEGPLRQFLLPSRFAFGLAATKSSGEIGADHRVVQRRLPESLCAPAGLCVASDNEPSLCLHLLND